MPLKNFRKVGGKELWEWSLESAKSTECVNRIVVTTDAPFSPDGTPIYLLTGCDFVCDFVRRPPELATDDAPLDDALIHAIDEVGLDDSDIVVLLQPTVPVRRPGLVDDCVKCFQRFPAAKSLVTANRLHYVWAGDAGMLVNPPRVNRQAMSSSQILYEEDGSVFVVRAGDLRRTRNRIVEPMMLIETERTVDIDTEHDMEIAEFLLSRSETETCRTNRRDESVRTRGEA